eukprot:364453-Chlamydomonas_euryale.AAC.16
MNACKHAAAVLLVPAFVRGALHGDLAPGGGAARRGAVRRGVRLFAHRRLPRRWMRCFFTRLTRERRNCAQLLGHCRPRNDSPTCRRPHAAEGRVWGQCWAELGDRTEVCGVGVACSRDELPYSRVFTHGGHN